MHVSGDTDGDKLYEVLSNSYNSGTHVYTITLTSNYPTGFDPSGATIYYYSLNKLALYQNANNCMLNNIGNKAIKLDASDCDDCTTMTCSKGVNAFNDFYTCIVAAENCGNYAVLDANIATYTTLYCGTGTSCGCGT
jgi:hypothetical protein